MSEAFKKDTSPDKLNLGASCGRGDAPLCCCKGLPWLRRRLPPILCCRCRGGALLPGALGAGVGAYRTEELQPYVLKVVRKVGWAGLAGS